MRLRNGIGFFGIAAVTILLAPGCSSDPSGAVPVDFAGATEPSVAESAPQSPQSPQSRNTGRGSLGPAPISRVGTERSSRP
jgi:hypothetical protein